jgi:hypothetical protein
MGVIYLMYSAYFLSTDFVGMKSFVDAVLTFIYAILGLTNFKSLNEQTMLMKQLLRQADDAMPASFVESIKLKLSMLQRLKIVIVLFFIPKLLTYAYEAINPTNDFMVVRF